MIKQRLLGLLATVSIVGFVVGVPLVLTAIGAVPSATTLNTVRDVLFSPDDGTLVIGMAAVVAWGAWAIMTVSLVVEAVAALRGVRAPKLPGLSMTQVAAGQLIAVASLLFAGTSMAAPGVAPATAHAAVQVVPRETVTAPLAVEVVPERAPVEHTAVATAPTVKAKPAKPPETRLHVVRRGESLWSIARDQLGEGTRYVELVDLNSDVLGGHPDFITPGLELLLPVDPDQPKTDGPHTRIVEPGDTLSEIALDEYADATRYPEIVKASHDTVQPDGDRLTDPDLIRPGWKFTIPGDTPKKPVRPSVVAPEPEPMDVAPSAPPPPTPSASPTPDEITPTRAPTPQPEVAAEHEEVTDHTSTAPGWLLPGLTGAGVVLAGSLFLVVRAHRRAQLRFRRPGHLIGPLPAQWADVDKTMHATGAPTATQLERLDALLRVLEAHASESDSRPPALLSIELDGRDVTLHLAQEASLPVPWAGSGATWSTRLPDEVEDVDELAPYPLLATVGSDASGHIWLANLEELKTVRVTGDRERALAFARHVTAELALAPWSALVTTDTLGLGSELAAIDALRHDHHPDGDCGFIDLLLRDLAVTEGPDLEPESYRALIATDSIETSDAVQRVQNLLRMHQSRPGAVVLLLGAAPETGDVEFILTETGRLLIPSLALDLEPVTMTAGEATACTAIVDLTRDAENVPMPMDGQAEEGWRALADLSGALRPELTEPRPTEEAGEDSLLPGATDTYLAAGATTAEDVETLAPVVIPQARTAVEDSDPQLDEDLEEWFAAEAHLPRLILLGTPNARTCGNPLAAASRKPFYVELLAFLVLHPHGVTTQEVATAFSLKTRRVSADLTAVRAWLGENPRTGNLHLPDARYNPAASERGTPAYWVEGVLADFDLFRRLRKRGQARGSDGIDDLVLALRLVTGEPFSGHRNGGWTWLRDGEPFDHIAACAIVDAAHAVATRALAEHDLGLARFAAETAYKAAPHDEIARLDLIDVASAEGHGELAKRQLADDVFNRSDDDLGPVDLPERTAQIVFDKGWSTNGRRPSDPH
jgi:nucleoid-associated protein YgaU